MGEEDSNLLDELHEDEFKWDWLPELDIMELVHERFRVFFNITTHGFVQSPPLISFQSGFSRATQIIHDLRIHRKKSTLSAFYLLTEYGYMLVCQIMLELSFILTHRCAILPLLTSSHLNFIFWLCCIYYGVEHYAIKQPRNLQHIGPLLLRQSLSKALHQLGTRLTLLDEPIVPWKEYVLRVPSGANVLELKYYAEGNIDDHGGTPYDSKEVLFNVQIRVRTLKMLPVVSPMYRPEYAVQEYLNTDAVNLVELPPYDGTLKENDTRFLKYRPGIDLVPLAPKVVGFTPL